MCLQQQLSPCKPLSHRNLFHPLGVGAFFPALVEVTDLHKLAKDPALFPAPSSLKDPQNKTKLMGASLWKTRVLLSFPSAEPHVLPTGN